MEAALASIESLGPSEKINYAKIARKFGVNRSTLSKRHRSITHSKSDGRQQQLKLDQQHEIELIRYINRSTERRLPPNRRMIRKFAMDISGQQVGVNWVDRFLKRHADQLLFKWTNPMDANRHRADSGSKYEKYFALLRDAITRFDIQPENTYNMDEKGFALGVLNRSKRVFSRWMWENGNVKEALQDGSREWITILACICADGSAIPPGVVYASANQSIQPSWVQDIEPGKHQIHVTSSTPGWSNDDIGLAWLEQVFDRYTRRKARRQYRLLILDGHGSHLSTEFIEYCYSHRILLFVFPPHSTHSLQPLDVVVFHPLATAYSGFLAEHLQNSQGLVPVKKGDFIPLFWKAWEKALTKENILSAFAATGISPLDPQRVLKRFNKITPDRSREGSVEASTWRQINRDITSAIEAGLSSTEADSLRQSLHRIQIQNELLQHENDGLRDALIQKKRKPTSRKPMDLQQRKEYHGGAVFWSPRKIREARTRQLIEDREKADQIQKKTG